MTATRPQSELNSPFITPVFNDMFLVKDGVTHLNDSLQSG